MSVDVSNINLFFYSTYYTNWLCVNIVLLWSQVTFKVYIDNDKFVKIKENEEIEPNFGSMPSMIHTLIQFWLTLFFRTVGAGSLFWDINTGVNTA